MSNIKQSIPQFLILAVLSAATLLPTSQANAIGKAKFQGGSAGPKMETIRKQICGRDEPVFIDAQPNTVEEKKANQKLIMIYTQLWNMYYIRNDSKLNDPTVRAEIDQLRNTSRPPCLTSDQPIDYVRSEILNNSVQLAIYLSREVGSAADEYTRNQAKSNARYLIKELQPRLEQHQEVIELSNEQFKNKFNLTERKKEQPPATEEKNKADQETIQEITRPSETNTSQ
jgi:hypothetical protein